MTLSRFSAPKRQDSGSDRGRVGPDSKRGVIRSERLFLAAKCSTVLPECPPLWLGSAAKTGLGKLSGSTGTNGQGEGLSHETLMRSRSLTRAAGQRSRVELVVKGVPREGLECDVTMQWPSDGANSEPTSSVGLWKETR